jgi:hypothetical protein
MKTYDPAFVTATFKGHLIQGYADGEFISAARDEAAFSKSAGAGGDVVRVRNRNKMGTVTITVQAQSPTNDVLSGYAAADELLTGAGVGALLITELNGTTVIRAAEAWIEKMPDAAFSKEAGTREWVFACASLEMFEGGALT